MYYIKNNCSGGTGMTMRLIPDVIKSFSLYSVSLDATALDAATLMAEKSIGVVLVMDQGRLCGIFSERDLMTRVVARDLAPSAVNIREVTTKDVVSVEARCGTRTGFSHGICA
jgi:CBS domain-containing protein